MLDYKILTTDILIIGGGGAAALAALAAASHGVEVIQVSKESSLVGGATKQANGGISISYEEDDNPEIFYNDILKAGAKLNNPELARIVTSRSKAALLNLEKYGILLDRIDANTFRRVLRSEGHQWARGYLDRRENIGWSNGLAGTLARSSVKFYSEVIIERLLLNQGQVVGALGYSLVTGEYLVFNAKAVLLATGGLGQLYEVTTNAKSLTGDGYAMAWDVGAKLVDMEMVQFLPLCFPYPNSRKGVIIGMCSILGPNVKLYNRLGERYMQKYDQERWEYTTRDIAARGSHTEIMEGRGTERGAIIVDTTDQDRSLLPKYKSAQPIVFERLKAVFGEDAANWKKPFEAMPAQHFFMGGVMIDGDCKTSIPGLFAVGEVSGGVHGGNRLSGVALTEILVFGDIAGQSIAKWIKKQKLIPYNTAEIEEAISHLQAIFTAKTKDGLRPFHIKGKIKSIMWRYLGPVRNKDGMETSITLLNSIQTNELPRLCLSSYDDKYNRERMEAIETGLMVKTAKMVVYSALNRTESRGSHYRKDFPNRNDREWLKNTIIGKNSQNDITISYRPVLEE